MKTTLIIPDPVFRDLKRHAAERGETLSALVTECLRQGLREDRKSQASLSLSDLQCRRPPKGERRRS